MLICPPQIQHDMERMVNSPKACNQHNYPSPLPNAKAITGVYIVTKQMAKLNKIKTRH